MGPPLGPTDGDPTPSTAWEASHTLAADRVQRPSARAVSIKGEIYGDERERGRRGGDLSATPTLPTDASAADPIKRRMSVRVPKQNHRLNEVGRRRPLLIPQTAPADRFQGPLGRGQRESTNGCQRGFH